MDNNVLVCGRVLVTTFPFLVYYTCSICVLCCLHIRCYQSNTACISTTSIERSCTRDALFLHCCYCSRSSSKSTGPTNFISVCQLVVTRVHFQSRGICSAVIICCSMLNSSSMSRINSVKLLPLNFNSLPTRYFLLQSLLAFLFSGYCPLSW